MKSRLHWSGLIFAIMTTATIGVFFLSDAFPNQAKQRRTGSDGRTALPS